MVPIVGTPRVSSTRLPPPLLLLPLQGRYPVAHVARAPRLHPATLRVGSPTGKACGRRVHRAGQELGEGLCFRKYFEKFAGLARREKFPEICSDRHDMGTSDPLKMISDHSRPPETASRRHGPYKYYSILKGSTLEVHQGPAYGAV